MLNAAPAIFTHSLGDETAKWYRVQYITVQ